MREQEKSKDKMKTQQKEIHTAISMWKKGLQSPPPRRSDGDDRQSGAFGVVSIG